MYIRIVDIVYVSINMVDGTNAWFHFCVSGMAKGVTLKLQVRKFVGRLAHMSIFLYLLLCNKSYPYNHIYDILKRYLICDQVMNATNHSSLYKQDMRPVYRSKVCGNDEWRRVKHPVKFSKGGESDRCACLCFEHTVDTSEDTIYFAFTYPYTYEMAQKDLQQLETHTNDLSTPGSVFYQREILTKTPEVRMQFTCKTAYVFTYTLPPTRA